MFTGPKQDRRHVQRRSIDRVLLRCEREIEAATRITRALFEHLTLDELVVKALQIAIEVVNAECGSILLADPPSKQLIFHHSIGISSVPSAPRFHGIKVSPAPSFNRESLSSLRRTERSASSGVG